MRKRALLMVLGFKCAFALRKKGAWQGTILKDVISLVTVMTSPVWRKHVWQASVAIRFAYTTRPRGTK